MTTQTPAEHPWSASPAVAAWTRLLRAHAAATRVLSAGLQAQHGVGLNDFEALVLLAGAEERRLRRVDLARQLGLTPSGITRLLDGLEEAGLVARAACPVDRRVVYAQLTDAGADLLAAASRAHVGAIEALLEEHLAPAELEELAALLGKLPGVPDERCPAAGLELSG
ncbi:MAG TPA: MarR family transcriptional regulator [Gaiellaceae bacterium]|nr:MarR family transcriptional regulator [Gaiellaceae bacterium]